MQQTTRTLIERSDGTIDTFYTKTTNEVHRSAASFPPEIEEKFMQTMGCVNCIMRPKNWDVITCDTCRIMYSHKMRLHSNKK